jgi:hypothetical protein
MCCYSYGFFSTEFDQQEFLRELTEPIPSEVTSQGESSVVERQYNERNFYDKKRGNII